MSIVEVAIIGGVPAGSYFAYKLAQHNLQPVIFDKLWKKAYGRRLFTNIELRKLICNKPILEPYCTFFKHKNRLHL